MSGLLFLLPHIGQDDLQLHARKQLLFANLVSPAKKFILVLPHITSHYIVPTKEIFDQTVTFHLAMKVQKFSQIFCYIRLFLVHLNFQRKRLHLVACSLCEVKKILDSTVKILGICMVALTAQHTAT